MKHKNTNNTDRKYDDKERQFIRITENKKSVRTSFNDGSEVAFQTIRPEYTIELYSNQTILYTKIALLNRKAVTTLNSETICNSIEDEIVTGRIAPGTKLDEVGLCERFGVSRTPVREALRFLAERGLIELIRNRGAFVTELSAHRLIEMFAVMAELEGMAGRLCARRITTEQKTELLQSHKACQSASRKKNPDDYYFRNETFHEAIVAGANNSFLAEQATSLRRRLQPYRRMQLRVPKRIRDSLTEHDAIVEAIVAGKAAQAERRLKEHVMIQGERFTDFIAMLPDNTCKVN